MKLLDTVYYMRIYTIERAVQVNSQSVPCSLRKKPLQMLARPERQESGNNMKDHSGWGGGGGKKQCLNSEH